MRNTCISFWVALITFLNMPSVSSEPLRSMQYSTRQKSDAVVWQKTLRTQLFELLKLSDLKASPPSLNSRVLSTQEKDGSLYQEIEINATVGRKITVTYTRPLKNISLCPAVVCIHGHGGTRRSVYDINSLYKGFATELARRGYATIAVDVGQHTIYETNRTLMGERLWDLIRCIDFLESQKEVDASRIGCAGLSLGGEMAMWLGAMDERIAATVSAGFLTKMDQMEKNHCMCWKFPGLRELVDFADIYSLMAPRPLLAQNGLKEPPTQFTVELAKAALAEVKLIYNDFGKPDNAALAVHSEGHVIDMPSLLSFFTSNLNSAKK